jgi:hypothetical protein
VTPTLGTTTTGAAVPIQLDRLVESRLLLTANSGAGKSWAIRRLLEQTHGRVQHLVLDPEDEFHTLRERFDYVLAARHGADCIADPRHATLLARKLLELNASAVIGLHELKAHDRVRFVRGFLEALIDAPRSMWRPALVVIDEAHVFCPQHGQAESSGAVIDLMTRGRKRGLCGVLATQRISKLHKDAAAEANNKLVGRCALDVDMKRAADELGFSGREEQHALRTLPPGEFFAFGPALAESVTRMRVGTVATTHPKVGARSAPVPAARETARAVLAQLADLPREAEEEARTVESLGRRVRELEAELRKARAGAPDPEAIERARIAGLDAGRREADRRLQDLRGRARIALRALDECAGKVRDLRLSVAEADDATKAPVAASATSSVVAKPATRIPPRQVSRLRPETPRFETSDLGKCERAILAVLAQHSDGCTAGKLSLLAGYRWSGGFRNSLSALRTAGLIEGGNGEVMRLTPDGESAAAAFASPLPVGQALVDYWLTHPSLGKCEREILRALIGEPAGMTGHELAAATGYEWSGGFRNGLSSLRTAGLLVGRNGDRMQACRELREAAHG